LLLSKPVHTESQHLEYKRELTDALEREVVGFLNSREGGRILIGVDDGGRILGLVDPDGDQLKIKDRLKQNIQPSCLGLFDVLIEESEEKTWIKLLVASGSEKPYYLRKQGMSPRGCFLRIGSATEPMPARQIEALFAKRTRNSISRIVSPRQDLKFSQLKIYYEATGREPNAQFLRNLELFTEDDRYNYAAYLLADINNTSIKVAKYAGKDRIELIENEEYGNCCLVKATKQVLDKLDLENRTLTRITYKERQEIRLLDPVALREAVINAIIHNDYSYEGVPKFELFADRLEITSTGSIPQGMSESEFFEGYSIPRNKELMRIFRDLDMVEYLGRACPASCGPTPKNASASPKTSLG
jgi:predicted HTH transcriptional regulator